jgi:hypothetical protein
MHNMRVALSEDIQQVIRALQRNIICEGEFFNNLWGRLLDLPSAERTVLFEELLAHPDKAVRDEAERCRLMIHYGELSKDLNYILQNSPLKPGVQLELFGGYDHYTSGGPHWLNGRECYYATFRGFASSGENTIPVALVKLKDFVELPGHKGSFAILRTSYGPDSFAWGQLEGTAEVHIMEALPEELASIRSRLSADFATETHATYRVQSVT